MGIGFIKEKFKNKKLELENKRFGKLDSKKGKLIRKVAKAKEYEKKKSDIKKLKQQYADLTGRTERKQKFKANNQRLNTFGKKVQGNIKQRYDTAKAKQTEIYGKKGADNTPYWLKSSGSNNGLYGNNENSPPYWLTGGKEKKKEKKERRSITIRL